jgi:preprotein translocase subunit SecB
MAEENAASEQNKTRFIIQKIYTKDLSFETPNSPAIYQEEWNPKVDLQLGNEHAQLDEENHEVVLSVTVTAKVNDKIAFIAEVKQAGIFTLTGYNDQEMSQLVGNYCPNTLFPYAREAISDVVTKGGFPQLVLAPVNFDAVYKQRQEQARKQAAEQQAENANTH